MAIEIKMDGNDQPYIDVENLRITYISAARRAREKQWEGGDMIRIQAYVGDESNRVHPGPEIPVPTAEVLLELVEALLTIYKEGRHSAKREPPLYAV